MKTLVNNGHPNGHSVLFWNSKPKNLSWVQTGNLSDVSANYCFLYYVIFFDYLVIFSRLFIDILWMYSKISRTDSFFMWNFLWNFNQVSFRIAIHWDYSKIIGFHHVSSNSKKFLLLQFLLLNGSEWTFHISMNQLEFG